MAVQEITMQEYADHRGVTLGRISQAIGTILSKASYEKRINPKTKKWNTMINPVMADLEWERNSPSATRKPKTIRLGGAGKFKPEEKAAIAILESGGAVRSKPSQRAAQAANAPERKTEDPFLTDEQKELIDLNMRKKRAEVLKMEADSVRSQMEVEEKAKILVMAEEFEDLFSTMVADARDMLLGMRDRLRADFPEAPPSLMESIEKVHTEFLTKLARPNGVPGIPNPE